MIKVQKTYFAFFCVWFSCSQKYKFKKICLRVFKQSSFLNSSWKYSKIKDSAKTCKFSFSSFSRTLDFGIFSWPILKKDCLKNPYRFLYFWELENQKKKWQNTFFGTFSKRLICSSMDTVITDKSELCPNLQSFETTMLVTCLSRPEIYVSHINSFLFILCVLISDLQGFLSPGSLQHTYIYLCLTLLYLYLFILILLFFILFYLQSSHSPLFDDFFLPLWAVLALHVWPFSHYWRDFLPSYPAPGVRNPGVNPQTVSWV